MTTGSGGCVIGNIGVKITTLVGGTINGLISELADIKIGDEIISNVWTCANATGSIRLDGGNLICTNVDESVIMLSGSGMIKNVNNNNYCNLWRIQITKTSNSITFFFIDNASGINNMTSLTTCSLNGTYLISKS